MSENPQGSRGAARLRLLPSLNTPLTAAALILGCVPILFSYAESHRQQPDVKLHVEHYAVRADPVKRVTADTLALDLEGLESTYRHVSGTYLIDAMDRVLEVTQAVQSSGEGASQEGDAVQTKADLVAILSDTQDQLAEELRRREERRGDLIGGLKRLLESGDEVWSDESWHSNIREELENLERLHADQTGLGIVALLWEVDSSPPEEMKERIGGLVVALEEERGLDEGDLADLLEELDGLRQQHAESEPTQRLHVELLLENHSQLGTVVPRKARIRFTAADGSTEDVELTADGDVRMEGHSVANMQVESKGLGDLDSEVAGLLRGLEGRPVRCDVVVLDLSGRSWFGECGKVSRAVSLDERLKQALSQAKF